MAQPISQSDTPRRPRRSPEEQKQALADKIAALDRRLIESNRKALASVVEACRKLGRVGLSEAEITAIDHLTGLSSAKPGEGK